MTDTFVFSRLDSIEKRFQEIDILLKYAKANQKNPKTYSTFCRSAHIILIAHFEGLIKEICKDVIGDLNFNNSFELIPDKIFATFCEYFLIKERKEYNDKSIYSLRQKLKEAFGSSKSNLKVEPFLFTVNRNLAPAAIETILQRFGVFDFFWSLKNSDLDIVFKDSKTESNKLRKLLYKYIHKNVKSYPYKVDNKIYNPDLKILESKSQKTLWEDFIDDILKERHGIVHGQELENPYDHEILFKSKVKIEILLYAFIINICSVANPRVNI